MRITLIAITISAFAFVAYAESPYVGQEAREIKALSSTEMEGYLTGKGMGFAKAAELNHYPGPRHVLDIADQLELTSEQISQTQELFNSMKKKASALGKELVEKERQLDRLFANSSIDAHLLSDLLLDIGTLQANIRYAHLNAHLGQRALLSKHQTRLYDQIRGYGTADCEKGNRSH